MKFKYEQGLIPAKEINISSGLESIIDSNLEAIELQDYKFAFESCMIDTFEISKGMEADEDKPETSEAKEAWYVRLWKWIKDMFTKLGSYLVAGFRWLKRIFFRDESPVANQEEKMQSLITIHTEIVKERPSPETDERDRIHDEIESGAVVPNVDNVKNYYDSILLIAKEKLNKSPIYSKASVAERNRVAEKIAKSIVNKGENLKVEVYVFDDAVEKRINEIPKKEFEHFNTVVPYFTTLDKRMFLVSPAYALVDMNANIYTLTRITFGKLTDFDYEDLRKEMDKSRGLFASMGVQKDSEISFAKQIEFCRRHVNFLKSVQNKGANLLKKVTHEFSLDKDGYVIDKSLNEFRKKYRTTIYLLPEINNYFSSMEKDMSSISRDVNKLDVKSIAKKEKLLTSEAEEIFKDTKELFKLTFEASQLILSAFKNSLVAIKRASAEIDKLDNGKFN